MRRHAAMLIVGLTVFAPAVFTQAPAAQSPPAQRAEQAKQVEERARREQTAKPAVVVDPSAGGQPVNVRLEVSIVDHAAAGSLPPKTLTLILADRSNSSVRAPFEDRSVNIDARPTIVDGRIRLTFTIVVDLRKVPDNSNGGPAAWRQTQMMTTMLESGKPLIVMETLDPSFNNKKTTVEVKATILK